MSDKMWDPLSSMKASPSSPAASNHYNDNETDADVSSVTNSYASQSLSPSASLNQSTAVRKPIHSAEVSEPLRQQPILNSKPFNHFRATYSKRSIAVTGRTWTLYEVQPTVTPVSSAPLIFIPGTATTPESFYQQMSFFAGRGFSCMAVGWPAVWTKDEFVGTFRQFLDACMINSVHLIGVGLGGFLALSFAANCPERVESVAVSNAFMDTRPITKAWPVVKGMKMMPDSTVKKLVTQKLPQFTRYPYALEFVKHHFSLLSQPEVASRMTIQSTQATVTSLSQIDQERLVIIDTQDESTLPQSMREQLTSTLHKARQAGLREGGEYPWLSVPEDFNAMLLLHMRKMVELGPKPILAKGAKTPTSAQSPIPVAQSSPRSASPQPTSPAVHQSISQSSSPVATASPVTPVQPTRVEQSHPFESAPKPSGSGFGFLKPAHTFLAPSPAPAPVAPVTPADVTTAVSAADAYEQVVRPADRAGSPNLEKISNERAAIIAGAAEDAERRATETARLTAEAEARRIEERQRLEEEAIQTRESERLKLEKEKAQQKRTDDMLASLMG